MTAWLLPLAVGVGTGILSAWGVGGGTLLLLVMTLFLGVEQSTAQGINLLYFLPTAGAGLLFHRKSGLLDRQVLGRAGGGSRRVGGHRHGHGAAAQALRRVSVGHGRDDAAEKRMSCHAAHSFFSYSYLLLERSTMVTSKTWPSRSSVSVMLSPITWLRRTSSRSAVL